MPRILLIDDDERLAELLREYFQRFDLTLVSATRPSVGLEQLHSGNFDLVILDIMLPEMDGFEVCKAIRKHSDVPIIMLTARGDVMDRIVGLELGADDYLPKPFEPRELVARIQGVLKRTQQSSRVGVTRVFGDLVIDTRTREVTLDGEQLPLSAMEYELLALLSGEPGVIFSRDDILNRVKGVDADIYSRSVDILVSRLRNKLKPMQLIKTVRGRGYLFVGTGS